MLSIPWDFTPLRKCSPGCRETIDSVTLHDPLQNKFCLVGSNCWGMWEKWESLTHWYLPCREVSVWSSIWTLDDFFSMTQSRVAGLLRQWHLPSTPLVCWTQDLQGYTASCLRNQLWDGWSADPGQSLEWETRGWKLIGLLSSVVIFKNYCYS